MTARKGAAGWGGDRYELWRKGNGTSLLMRWRWDTPADAREFFGDATAYLRDGRDGTPPSPGAPWKLPDSSAALTLHGSVTQLAFAPTPAAVRGILGRR